MKLILDIQQEGEHIKSITIKNPHLDEAFDDASTDTSSFYSSDTDSDIEIIDGEKKKLREQVVRLVDEKKLLQEKLEMLKSLVRD